MALMSLDYVIRRQYQVKNENAFCPHTVWMVGEGWSRDSSCEVPQQRIRNAERLLGPAWYVAQRIVGQRQLGRCLIYLWLALSVFSRKRMDARRHFHEFVVADEFDGLLQV